MIEEIELEVEFLENFVPQPLPQQIPPVIMPDHAPRIFYADFRYSEYDWAAFDGGYAVIPLTQGYFTIVDKKDYPWLSRYKWCANVQRNEKGQISKVYAVTYLRAGMRYMHRMIAKAGRAVIIDHFNGLSLDNRRRNFRATTPSGNVATRSDVQKSVETDLPRGVERWGKFYGGVIKCHGRRYRSGMKWDTPGPARAWYLNKYKSLHGYRCPTTRESHEKSYPIFPPRKDDCPF